MLNKKICKVCIAAKAGKPTSGFPDQGAAARWMDWCDGDDKRWKKGTVICRNFALDPPHSIDRPPPSWCKYAVEHVVAEKK